MTMRRTLLAGLGLSACVLPWRAALAQAKTKRIGVLSGGRPLAAVAGQVPPHPFLVGMRERGYVEGRDFVVDWRYAEGRYELLGPFADELVRSEVDVIVALNTRGAQEAQRATKTIPIVFASISDPLGSGLVTNLAHPGGNISGVSGGLDDTVTKHLELMRTTLQRVSRLAVLSNPDNTFYEGPLARLQKAAQTFEIAVVPVFARSVEEMSSGLAGMKAAGVQGVLVFDDSLFFLRRRELAEFAVRAGMPAIAGNREYAESGLLYSYGGLLTDQFQRAAYYVDKILRGAKPGDLPVEQPTRYSFVVNRKTARALGLTLPSEFLLRADAVIE
jgi:putative ABC transport system substrate-binding protein